MGGFVGKSALHVPPPPAMPAATFLRPSLSCHNKPFLPCYTRPPNQFPLNPDLIHPPTCTL